MPHELGAGPRLFHPDAGRHVLSPQMRRGGLDMLSCFPRGNEGVLQSTASPSLVTCPCRASCTSSGRPRPACALDPSAHVQLVPEKVYRCVSVYLASQPQSRLTAIGRKFRRRFSHPVRAASLRLERARGPVPSPPRLLSIQGRRTAVPGLPRAMLDRARGESPANGRTHSSVISSGSGSAAPVRPLSHSAISVEVRWRIPPI